MAPSVNGNAAGGDLEAQWFAQMKAMRDAIAELKLSQIDGGQVSYGADLVVEDEASTLASSGDDMWDLIDSDGDEADSLSSDDIVYQSRNSMDGFANGSAYDIEWLEQVCAMNAAQKSGLDAKELQEQVQALLSSDLQGREQAPQYDLCVLIVL